MDTNGYEPTVSVSTKMAGDTVEIKVDDNANGIPQKVIEKNLFSHFSQQNQRDQGTGLAIIKLRYY
jgi:sensor histidine kinase regulating citrate/malate metabolism